MATPKKPETAATSQAAKIASQLAKQARVALQNPAVQGWLAEHADEIMSAAKQWAASVGDKVGDRFGQKGLERRAAKLRTTVTTLSADSSALATALRPVAASLDEVDTLLDVAAALPFAKRKKAHMKIDDILDELENGLYGKVVQRDEPDRP